MARPKGQRGPVPPQLVGQGFDSHPERINRSGNKGQRSIFKLRDKIQDMLAESVEVTVGKGKYRRKIRMSRMEHLLMMQMESRDPRHSEQIWEYGFGKSVGALELEQIDSPPDQKIVLPSELVARSFSDLHRDILAGSHMEYVCKGGRGSTKSSFVSLEIICLLTQHPQIHALALRQVAETLRDSVYSQLVWAIGMLGLEDKFKCTTSPIQIEYIPTGQFIYFRGANKPEMIKSIKPTFGYIGIVWFEELDQFHGQESIRKIEQSVLRGGELAWEFKTYNPPPTQANWVNKYVLIPKANQLIHHSSYLDVPTEWLGRTFLDEAEHLKEVHPEAYRHEYGGEVTGSGGMVFDNVVLREIPDEEILTFNEVLDGVDWGFYPDPFHWLRCSYNAAQLTLIIWDEFRAWKMSNKDSAEVLMADPKDGGKGVSINEQMIADSAEPKSVADYRAYGLACRGAEKGPDSLKYSMKWLQGLKQIVIDPKRAPYAATEFMEYEFEKDPDGEIISAYPDKNDHAIAAARYATNLIWRTRGQ